MLDHVREHQELQKSRLYGALGKVEETQEGKLTKSMEDELEKGAKGSGAAIGTIKNMGGRDYIKIASGWKYHGKGTGAKATEHATSAGHASFDLAEGHKVTTEDGHTGTVSKIDDTHHHITYKGSDGKDKVSKVVNDKVKKHLDAGTWEHHIPAKAAKEASSATARAAAGLNGGSSKAEMSEADKMAADKMSDPAQRFKAFGMFVNQVIKGKSKAAIAYGTGGVGKTYTVIKQLTSAGKKPFDEEDMAPGSDDYDYVKVTGKMTAPQLYKTMYQHNGKILLFDDCDSVLRDGNSVNLFKGALDTSGDGTIAYGTSGGVKDDEGEKLPPRFKFTGRVIFVSNLPPDQMPQPLKSRALKVDLTMDKKQTIDRIKDIAKDDKGQYQNLKFPGIDKYSHKDMSDVIDYIDKNKDMIGDLNVRTVGKMLGIKQEAEEMGEGKDWESFADQELFSKSEASGVFNYNGGLMKSRQVGVESIYKSKMKEKPDFKSDDVKSKVHIHLSKEQLDDAGINDNESADGDSGTDNGDDVKKSEVNELFGTLYKESI